MLIVVLNSILKPLSIFMCTTCTQHFKFSIFLSSFQYFHLMNYEQLLQYINVMIKVLLSSALCGKMGKFLRKEREKWQMCGYVAWLCGRKIFGIELGQKVSAIVNDLNFALLSHLLRKCHRDFRDFWKWKFELILRVHWSEVSLAYAPESTLKN